jgi:tetratricopeptide (TPR) repeat protein
MSGLTRLTTVLAGAALVTGCQTIAGFFNDTALAAPGKVSMKSISKDCFRDPMPGYGGDYSSLSVEVLQRIASDCTDAAPRTDSISQRTTSLLHVGQADLALGARALADKNNQESSARLGLAASALEKVLGATLDDVTVDKTKADIAARAALDLSRVYEMQRRYPEALAAVDQMLKVRPGSAAAYYQRSQINLARGGADSLRAAVDDLAIFSSDLKTENPNLVDQGRRELVVRSVQLGNAILDGSQTREGAQAAIDAFGKAEAGAVASKGAIDKNSIAAIYSSLGRAKLRMAGLSTPGGSAEYGCAAGVAQPYWLNAALVNFRSALVNAPDSPEANAGVGCALQALDSPNDAIPAFSRAAELAPNNVGNQLALARALAAANRSGEAAPIYENALSLVRDNPGKTSQILVEIAQIHLQTLEGLRRAGSTDEARKSAEMASAIENLDLAVKADPANVAARVWRGEFYVGYRPNAVLARKDLLEAERLTRFSNEKMLRAEALYRLSQLEMRPPVNPRAAIDDAKGAVAIVDRTEYKDHACLVHIKFLPRFPGLDGDTKNYCGAGRSDSDAKGKLYEGMYYLGTTQFKRGRDQDNGWESASKSFENGLVSLGQPSVEEGQQVKDLRAKLFVGLAYAYSCIGMRGLGGDMLVKAGAGQEDARQFFTDYGVGTCARR